MVKISHYLCEKEAVMTYKEFEDALKLAGIDKKAFSRMTGLNYTSITNWSQEGKTIPFWVKSYLEYFTKSKLYDEMASKMAEVQKRS